MTAFRVLCACTVFASATAAMRAQEPVATLRGHTGYVKSIGYSPDGKTLASAGADATVKLWDVAAAQVRATLKGHTADVVAITFSPDGKTLASASQDRTVRLWDASTGMAVGVLEGHSSLVISAAFSPDGKTLAAASSKPGPKNRRIAVVRLWDVTFLAAAGLVNVQKDRRSVRLWDVASMRELNRMVHESRILCLAFSADSKTLATGCKLGQLQCWDVATSKPIELPGQSSYVHSVAFAPDGKRLAVATHDGVIRLWDMTKVSAQKLK
jgi:WD40 repeat protein